uniref:Uncharacterized protein n=1 Tax=Plasmopara viticola lesion associated ourmia-like virus 35 TaxID=2686504 RepID=A0A9E8YXB7_9VIRU|nr:MAG: hypothetical protein [Plasmopara viticola lesion associated ourmia-like virus 35]
MRPSRLDHTCPTSSRWVWYDTKVVEKRSVSFIFLKMRIPMKKREPTSVWHFGVSHSCAGPRRGKVVWDSHHLRSGRPARLVAMSIPEVLPSPPSRFLAFAGLRPNKGVGPLRRVVERGNRRALWLV